MSYRCMYIYKCQLEKTTANQTVIFFWKFRWLRLLRYLSMRSRRSSALYLPGAGAGAGDATTR